MDRRSATEGFLTCVLSCLRAWYHEIREYPRWIDRDRVYGAKIHLNITMARAHVVSIKEFTNERGCEKSTKKFRCRMKVPNCIPQSKASSARYEGTASILS